MDKNLIIGTAGHIDHGKTTLIKALTGKDTDRLSEEKKRGISIELGFSCLKLSDDLKVGIIDVPGHEKFIKNMLAGAGGVDLGLLIVAADEGFMAQTEEHLAILDLLNIKHGIIVITKIDQVENEWLELIKEDVKEKVEDTFLEGVPIISVSAIKGEGIEELKDKIAKIVESIPAKDDQANLYFPIDRVFSLTGHGTIVTGTLIKGKVKSGDQLKIYPSGLDVRVRSLQVHEKEVDTAFAGQRVGINLAGINTDEIDRGDVLGTKESLVKTEYLDARLQLLSSAPFILQHGDRIRLHLGAKEVLGRVYLLDQKELYPGEEGLVQFRLEEEIVANFKERYILRRYSPMTTIGGGEILDTKPNRHRRLDKNVIEALKIKDKGSLEERVELDLRLANNRPLTIQNLVKRTSLASEQLTEVLAELKEVERVIEFKTGKNSSWIHINHYQQLQDDITAYLNDYHHKYHLRLGMNKEELRTKLFMELDPKEYNILLDDLVAREEIAVQGAQVSLAEFELEYTSQEEAIKEDLLALYSENKFAPPSLNNVLADFDDNKLAEEVANSLMATEELIEVTEGICFESQALLKAESILVDHLRKEGEIELGEYRDLLNSSRKYTLALLKYFDQQGLTKRKGDKRILANNNKLK